MDWYRLFHPSFWIQNYPTNLDYDHRLNEALDQNKVVPIDEYTCKIGSLEVWIANYPHAYGTPYFRGRCGGILPKAKTRVRLRKAYADGLIAQMKESS